MNGRGYIGLLFIAAAVLVSAGCAGRNTNTAARTETKPALMPNDFWGKGEDSDLPAAFEAVRADDSSKGGDTHFEAHGFHYTVTFQKFDTKAEADKKLDSIDDSKVKGRGDVVAPDRRIVGAKVIYTESKTVDGQTTVEYCLAWTRNNRWALVTADRMEALVEYQKDRGV